MSIYLWNSSLLFSIHVLFSLMYSYVFMVYVSGIGILVCFYCWFCLFSSSSMCFSFNRWWSIIILLGSTHALFFNFQNKFFYGCYCCYGYCWLDAWNFVYSFKNVQMCENVSSAIVAHSNQMFALEIEVDPYGSRRLSSDDTLIIDSLHPFLTIYQYYLLHLNYYYFVPAAAVVAVPVYSIFELHSH